MLKVNELKNNDIFPKEFLDVLPSKCAYCGEDLEITETLTMLKCVNPNCIGKGVQRMLALLRDLGIKDMGESECKSFMTKFKTTNPYAILLYNPKIDGVLYEGCSEVFSKGIYKQINNSRSMYLWEFVTLGNLYSLGDTARKLFINYDSLDVFYKDLYEGGICFVHRLLGLGDYLTALELEDDRPKLMDFIKGNDLVDLKGLNVKIGGVNIQDKIEGYRSSSSVSVKAIEVYNTLIACEHELRSGIEGVELKATLGIPVINICISTSVGKPYRNKKDFILAMTNLVDGRVQLNVLPSLTKDCNYLIWSKEGNATSKVNKAIKYNIPIYKGIEFEEYLKKRCL